MKHFIAFFIFSILYFLAAGALVYISIAFADLNFVTRIGNFIAAGLSALIGVICFIIAKRHKS